MALGAHGNSFLKKALKEMKQTKKRNCRICKKGAEGANSEAWNVQFGPRSPARFGSPRFSGREEKHRQRESTSSLGRGDETAAGESLTSQTLEGRPFAGGQENGCPCASTAPTA